MISGEDRYGWIAALLALLLTPLAGMLYAGHARRGVFYLVLMLAAVLVLPWGIPAGLQAPVPSAPALWQIVFLLIWLVGVADAYRVAAQHDKQYALPGYSRWQAIAFCLFAVYLAFVIEQAFVIEPVRIVNDSMAPTLLRDDFVGVAKYAYGVQLPFGGETILETGWPERGDVILFRLPQMPLRRAIQRVIGIAGDSIEYRNKLVSVNGQILDTQRAGSYTYLADDWGTPTIERYEESVNGRPHSILIDAQSPVLRLADVLPFPFKEACMYAEDGVQCRVPPGHYFTLQDNRDRANDGRYWGFVPEKNVVGKVIAVGISLRTPERNATVVK